MYCTELYVYVFLVSVAGIKGIMKGKEECSFFLNTLLKDKQFKVCARARYSTAYELVCGLGFGCEKA